MSHTRRRSHAIALVLSLALGACTSSTGPGGVDATIQEMTFATAAEAAAWPQTPTISGGPRIVVRGTAVFGCGDANVQATRRGSRIDVVISAVNTERFCLGIVMGRRAYEVRVLGLEAGSYTVRVRSVGLRGEATWIVDIGAAA